MRESHYNVVVREFDDGSVLLCNTVTTSLALFRREVYNSFHNMSDISNIDPRIMEQGFVVESDEDSLYNSIVYREIETARDGDPSHSLFVIAPTMKCNYTCDYCFEEGRRTGCIMNEDTCDHVIQFIINQIDKTGQKQCFIEWFGGEPLLAYDAIIYISQRLFSYCKKNGVRYHATMVSNGSLMTLEMAKFLSSDCCVDNIQISIDGGKEYYCTIKHCNVNDYDNVMNSFEYLPRYMNTLVRLNCSDLSVAKDWMLEISNVKLDNIHIFPSAVNDYRFKQYGKWRDVISLYKYARDIGIEKLCHPTMPSRLKFACSALNRASSVIGPDGALYACDHCIGNSNYRIGDVFRGLKIDKPETIFADISHPSKCRECALFPWCLGGCKANETIEGMTLNCDDRCRYWKEILFMIYERKKGGA